MAGGLASNKNVSGLELLDMPWVILARLFHGKAGDLKGFLRSWRNSSMAQRQASKSNLLTKEWNFNIRIKRKSQIFLRPSLLLYKNTS